MSFLVRVAVLPTQISETMPMFSQASRFLIKRPPSDFMVSTEKAIEMEMARGRPSGTATIMMVMAMVRMDSILRRVSLENMLSEDVNMILNVKNADIVIRTMSPAKYPHFPN